MDSDDEEVMMFLLMSSNSRSREGRLWETNRTSLRRTHGELQTLFMEERQNPSQFHQSYRMSPAAFDIILEKIAESIQYQDTNCRNCISPAERLAITLRYLATGMSQQDIARYFRVGKSTVSGIIPEVCTAIWKICGPEQIPSLSEDRLKNIAAGFTKWHFPMCMGAIDGKHILVQKPDLSGTLFHNYKGTFSMSLMAVCDANYCFTFVDIGGYGSSHDSTLFRASSLGQRLLHGTLPIPQSNGQLPYVFVADEAFPLQQAIMRPYPGRSLDTVGKKVYNYRLCSARRVVENAFGILSTKWRIFRQPIIAKEETIEAIVQATCILHNFLRRRDGTETIRYMLPEDVDNDSNQDGSWRSEVVIGMTDMGRTSSNSHSHLAEANRKLFVEYFMSPEGSVPWQLARINRGTLHN